MCEKYEKNGKVAVIISPGYGAGFSTWNRDHPEMVFDPDIAKLLDVKEFRECESEIRQIVKKKYPDAYFNPDRLVLVWLEKGTKFYVDEYDGSESIMTEESFIFTA